MSIISGVNVCTEEVSSFEALYSHDRGTKTSIISDALINDSVVAQERARAELVKGGYSERVVSIQSVHTLNLKQNDIVLFQGLYWIVKEISLSFTSPKLIQNIKGVRYE